VSVCCCRGLKSTDNKYFAGKKRYTHIVMQGRFKHDVNASELWTGHEWFQITDLVPTRCVWDSPVSLCLHTLQSLTRSAAALTHAHSTGFGM
jgi:hypothetical protein